MACVRRAWLVLDTDTIDLEDPAAGYFCSSLDLGYPAPREVTNDRPDADGVTDRTSLMGARVVQADITALLGAGATIDDVAAAFAPFMVPSARPILHYILDRPGAPERVLTVRASGYSWKVEGDNQRDISLQWLAADPIVRDPTEHVATAFAGTVGLAGRTYNLTYPRTYPTGTAAPSSAIIHSNGDLPVKPLLRIYGPIGGPVVTIRAADGTNYAVPFLGTFNIGAGTFAEVDTDAHTALYQGDPNQPILNQLDWTRMLWPVLAPQTDNTMSLTGSNTSPATQVQAIWQDGYLS
jgi:hypothetical protein